MDGTRYSGTFNENNINRYPPGNRTFFFNLVKHPDILPSMKELCAAIWFSIGLAYLHKHSSLEFLKKYRWQIADWTFTVYIGMRPLYIILKLKLMDDSGGR
jgi:hypothetical protein